MKLIAKASSKEVLRGVMYVVIAFFFINVVAVAFNLSTELQVILNFLPTVLALVLLLKATDIL